MVDLKAQYEAIRGEIDEAIQAVLESQDFIKGRFVSEFERAFTEMHGARFGLGCSNGTSAISTALQALGIGTGDEVITTPMTFIATVEAICHVGAKPVFVDIDPETYQMDIGKAEAAIGKATRAILPVHLYGNVCEMPALMSVAEAHGLKVVEDCAQAHFARFGGKFVGTFGDAATFSFYPGKNLGAFGDAGFILSRTQEAETLMRKLVDHGRMDKYNHDLIGFNNRMDGLQGAVLSVKLKHIQRWTKQRQSAAAKYGQILGDAGFRTMKVLPGAEAVYHLYPVQVANREEAMAYIREQGIASGIHYPTPLHLQPALAYLGHAPGDFPVSETLSRRVMSLPIFPEISDQQIARITSAFVAKAKQ